ncbi:MAG: terpene cyclase/mutase family protein [Planctomycetes bacterium]|nr:terpene cyclase/mutase family protein [Planctomycetota bacterium]
MGPSGISGCVRKALSPSRRPALRISALFICALLFVAAASAATRGEGPTSGASDRSPAVAEVTPEVEGAIKKGLAFLREAQHDSGAFSSSFPVGVTALAGLALLGAGMEYDRGEFGASLVTAVEYLLSRADARGYVNDDDSLKPSRMHGHAYAILFLSQVVGTLAVEKIDAEVRKAIQKGIVVIENSQTVDGGWGYKPGDRDDEASITVCCLQALRAAKDAGFLVSAEAIRGALRYLKHCAKEDGSFRYSLKTQGGDKSTYELTAAAVCTMHAAGEYTRDERLRGIEFLRRERKRYRKQPLEAAKQFYEYGNLYAAQVYYQLGGDDWERFAPAAQRGLIERQNAAQGYWESNQFGNEYATAVSLLILEIPLGFLPIFER